MTTTDPETQNNENHDITEEQEEQLLNGEEEHKTAMEETPQTTNNPGQNNEEPQIPQQTPQPNLTQDPNEPKTLTKDELEKLTKLRTKIILNKEHISNMEKYIKKSPPWTHPLR